MWNYFSSYLNLVQYICQNKNLISLHLSLPQFTGYYSSMWCGISDWNFRPLHSNLILLQDLAKFPVLIFFFLENMLLQVWFYLCILFLNMFEHYPFSLVISSPWSLLMMKNFPNFHSGKLNCTILPPLSPLSRYSFASPLLYFFWFIIHLPPPPPPPGLTGWNFPNISNNIWNTSIYQKYIK